MISHVEMSEGRLLADLKEEVESLRRKFMKPDAKAEELILEIESLKESIHELTIIFQKAVELTKEEDLSRSIQEKLDAVIKQNETIARGMVAISDKVDEFVAGKVSQHFITSQPPMKQGMGPLMMERVAPVPMAYSGMDNLQMPPPPPVNVRKRQGLF